MPEPIMLPTTSASAIAKPSCRGGDEGWISSSFTALQVLQLTRPCAIGAALRGLHQCRLCGGFRNRHGTWVFRSVGAIQPTHQYVDENTGPKERGAPLQRLKT